MITYTDTLILGGGPAGLAAAIALKDRALLIESGPTVGGMSASLSWLGATFDLGGHSFHTPHPHVRELVFGALEMFEQERDARCFHEGELIPFPFQQHFEKLPNPKTVEQCRRGLENRAPSENVPHFQALIDASYGPGLSQHFMTPYNQKVWGKDLSRLETSWTRERVPSLSTSETSSQGNDGYRRPLQSKSVVAYPARGGFGEIFLALGRRVRACRLNTRIASIDPVAKIATSSTGERFAYANLISTLPLPLFLDFVDGAPDTLVASVASLESTSLNLVFIVVNEPVKTPVQRLYSAESHIAAHKIALNHNSSEYLRKQPVHGIIAEISDLQSLGKTEEDLERHTLQNLSEMGIISTQHDVLGVKTMHFARAYPVPTHRRPKIVQSAKAWLEAHNIFTVGRFAEWAYINSDEALHRGLQTASRIECTA